MSCFFHKFKAVFSLFMGLVFTLNSACLAGSINGRSVYSQERPLSQNSTIQITVSTLEESMRSEIANALAEEGYESAKLTEWMEKSGALRFKVIPLKIFRDFYLSEDDRTATRNLRAFLITTVEKALAELSVDNQKQAELSRKISDRVIEKVSQRKRIKPVKVLAYAGKELKNELENESQIMEVVEKSKASSLGGEEVYPYWVDEEMKAPFKFFFSENGKMDIPVNPLEAAEKLAEYAQNIRDKSEKEYRSAVNWLIVLLGDKIRFDKKFGPIAKRMNKVVDVSGAPNFSGEYYSKRITHYARHSLIAELMKLEKEYNSEEQFLRLSRVDYWKEKASEQLKEFEPFYITLLLSRALRILNTELGMKGISLDPYHSIRVLRTMLEGGDYLAEARRKLCTHVDEARPLNTGFLGMIENEFGWNHDDFSVLELNSTDSGFLMDVSAQLALKFKYFNGTAVTGTNKWSENDKKAGFEVFEGNALEFLAGNLDKGGDQTTKNYDLVVVNGVPGAGMKSLRDRINVAKSFAGEKGIIIVRLPRGKGFFTRLWWRFREFWVWYIYLRNPALNKLMDIYHSFRSKVKFFATTTRYAWQELSRPLQGLPEPAGADLRPGIIARAGSEEFKTVYGGIASMRRKNAGTEGIKSLSFRIGADIKTRETLRVIREVVERKRSLYDNMREWMLEDELPNLSDDELDVVIRWRADETIGMDLSLAICTDARLKMTDEIIKRLSNFLEIGASDINSEILMLNMYYEWLRNMYSSFAGYEDVKIFKKKREEIMEKIKCARGKIKEIVIRAGREIDNLRQQNEPVEKEISLKALSILDGWTRSSKMPPPGIEIGPDGRPVLKGGSLEEVARKISEESMEDGKYLEAGGEIGLQVSRSLKKFLFDAKPRKGFEDEPLSYTLEDIAAIKKMASNLPVSLFSKFGDDVIEALSREYVKERKTAQIIKWINEEGYLNLLTFEEVNEELPKIEAEIYEGRHELDEDGVRRLVLRHFKNVVASKDADDKDSEEKKDPAVFERLLDICSLKEAEEEKRRVLDDLILAPDEIHDIPTPKLYFYYKWAREFAEANSLGARRRDLPAVSWEESGLPVWASIGMLEILSEMKLMKMPESGNPSEIRKAFEDAYKYYSRSEKVPEEVNYAVKNLIDSMFSHEEKDDNGRQEEEKERITRWVSVILTCNYDRVFSDENIDIEISNESMETAGPFIREELVRIIEERDTLSAENMFNLMFWKRDELDSFGQIYAAHKVKRARLQALPAIKSFDGENAGSLVIAKVILAILENEDPYAAAQAALGKQKLIENGEIEEVRFLTFLQYEMGTKKAIDVIDLTAGNGGFMQGMKRLLERYKKANKISISGLTDDKELADRYKGIRYFDSIDRYYSSVGKARKASFDIVVVTVAQNLKLREYINVAKRLVGKNGVIIIRFRKSKGLLGRLLRSLRMAWLAEVLENGGLNRWIDIIRNKKLVSTDRFVAQQVNFTDLPDLGMDLDDVIVAKRAPESGTPFIKKWGTYLNPVQVRRGKQTAGSLGEKGEDIPDWIEGEDMRRALKYIFKEEIGSNIPKSSMKAAKELALFVRRKLEEASNEENTIKLAKKWLKVILMDNEDHGEEEEINRFFDIQDELPPLFTSYVQLGRKLRDALRNAVGGIANEYEAADRKGKSEEDIRLIAEGKLMGIPTVEYWRDEKRKNDRIFPGFTAGRGIKLGEDEIFYILRFYRLQAQKLRQELKDRNIELNEIGFHAVLGRMDGPDYLNEVAKRLSKNPMYARNPENIVDEGYNDISDAGLKTERDDSLDEVYRDVPDWVKGRDLANALIYFFETEMQRKIPETTAETITELAEFISSEEGRNAGEECLKSAKRYLKVILIEDNTLDRIAKRELAQLLFSDDVDIKKKLSRPDPFRGVLVEMEPKLTGRLGGALEDIFEKAESGELDKEELKSALGEVATEKYWRLNKTGERLWLSLTEFEIFYMPRFVKLRTAALREELEEKGIPLSETDIVGFSRVLFLKLGRGRYIQMARELAGKQNNEGGSLGSELAQKAGDEIDNIISDGFNLIESLKSQEISAKALGKQHKIYEEDKEWWEGLSGYDKIRYSAKCFDAMFSPDKAWYPACREVIMQNIILPQEYLEQNPQLTADLLEGLKRKGIKIIVLKKKGASDLKENLVTAASGLGPERLNNLSHLLKNKAFIEFTDYDTSFSAAVYDILDTKEAAVIVHDSVLAEEKPLGNVAAFYNAADFPENAWLSVLVFDILSKLAIQPDLLDRMVQFGLERSEDSPSFIIVRVRELVESLKHQIAVEKPISTSA